MVSARALVVGFALRSALDACYDAERRHGISATRSLALRVVCKRKRSSRASLGACTRHTSDQLARDPLELQKQCHRLRAAELHRACEPTWHVHRSWRYAKTSHLS